MQFEALGEFGQLLFQNHIVEYNTLSFVSIFNLAE